MNVLVFVFLLNGWKPKIHVHIMQLDPMLANSMLAQARQCQQIEKLIMWLQATAKLKLIVCTINKDVFTFSKGDILWENDNRFGDLLTPSLSSDVPLAGFFCGGVFPVEECPLFVCFVRLVTSLFSF